MKIMKSLRGLMVDLKQSFVSSQAFAATKALSDSLWPKTVDEHGLHRGEKNALEDSTQIQFDLKRICPDNVKGEMVHLALPRNARTVVLDGVEIARDEMIRGGGKNGISEYFTFEANHKIYVLWTKDAAPVPARADLPVLQDEVKFANPPAASFETAMQAFRARTTELRAERDARHQAQTHRTIERALRPN